MHLRERVDLDPLAVGDRFSDLGVGRALKIGAKQSIALISLRLHRNITSRNLVFVAGRKNQVLATLPLVNASRAHVLPNA